MKSLCKILLALLPFACGCDEPAGYDYGDYLVEFVTFEGERDGMPCFTFQSRDDSPEQTLLSESGLDKDIMEGQRCLLQYTVLSDLPDRAKLIRVDYVSPIISDVARQASPSAIETLSDTPIDVVSLWRSGNFINLSGWVPYTGSRFGLLFVVDESTLDANTVVARIVYDVMGATPTFERRVYASFDIRNVWSRQSCHTLRVVVGNDTYEFSK